MPFLNLGPGLLKKERVMEHSEMKRDKQHVFLFSCHNYDLENYFCRVLHQGKGSISSFFIPVSSREPSTEMYTHKSSLVFVEGLKNEYR